MQKYYELEVDYNDGYGYGYYLAAKNYYEDCWGYLHKTDFEIHRSCGTPGYWPTEQEAIAACAKYKRKHGKLALISKRRRPNGN